MATTADEAPISPQNPYDAFVSYSSVDRRSARRVQRFLESWIDKRQDRRLRIFLDETDIRGGRLDAELRRAAHGARTLIVCYSPAAIESTWVKSEIRLFRERAEPDRIAIAIVGGPATLENAGRELVEGAELRVHDLRRGRWVGLIGLGVKLELLRLLAFVADVDMRTLRNWHLRRTVVHAVLVAVLTLLPLLAILNLPLEDWETLTLSAENQPLYPIAAEVSGDKLLIASRFRAASQERPRNYVRLDSIIPGANGGSGDFSGRFPFRHRLLPASSSAFGYLIPKYDVGLYTRRAPTRDVFVTEVSPGRWIVVQKLTPSEEELSAQRLAEEELGVPHSDPKSTTSLVIAIRDGDVRAAEVDGLLPYWQDSRDMDPASPGPVSPFKGLPVAWTTDGNIWLGTPGWDAQAEGGLWHSRDDGRSWVRIEGFASVSSIATQEKAGRLESVIVAESHFDRWRGPFLEPYATRVVEQRVGESVWREASMPPYSSRSEVESCGTLQGSEVVRVDELVYSQRDVALWRFLLKRAGIFPPAPAARSVTSG